ncbi:MAG: peptidoglycan-binding protein [Planctomycetes bacterium]|nr:peptidoglycan-binding protein [Planctomycetota bacterium]
MELGNTGPEVAALQRALNEHLTPSPGLTVDGEFGEKTALAVVRFQRQAGIVDDGLVGPQTMIALGADLDPYFRESSGIASSVGPQVITRNILQDRHGNYWLATWQGVFQYDGTTFVNITHKEGLRRYRVFCLLEDRRGDIWLGTTGAGVYRYDGETYTNYSSKEGLADDTVLSMYQDRSGSIWFGGGGGKGLTKYDGATFTSFTEDDGFTRSDTHSISEAPDGTLWFGTRGALFHYDGEKFENFTAKHEVSIDPNSYTPVIVNRRGHVWFSGSMGLYHYDGATVRNVFPLPSFSLMEDSHGNIWFSGGALRGEDAPRSGSTVLNRFDPDAGLDHVLVSSEQFAVEAGAVFGLTEDRDGSIWFGTGHGIGRIVGDVVQYY